MNSIHFLFREHSPSAVLGAWLVAVYCWWGVLAMGSQVALAVDRKVYLWQGFRAVFMGFGTWAFHFVGMLGWRPGLPLAFSSEITLLSLLISVLSSWPLLSAMARGASASQAWPNVLLYCAGLSAMHYSGVYAAETDPYVRWDPVWVVLSTLIALLLAIAVLDLKRWINAATLSERLGRRSLAALLLGTLLFAVHFTSIAGASYLTGTVCRTTGALAGEEMAALVALSTALIFSSAMWLSVTDARTETRLQQQATELQARAEVLEQMLQQDAITGLPNQMALDAELTRAAEAGALPVALLCIELDGYQVIADSWGPAAATELAQAAAHRLLQATEYARIVI